ADRSRGDRDAADHRGRVAYQQRLGEQAATVGVVAVCDQVRRAAGGVAPHGPQLLDERIAGPASTAKTAALDDLKELLDIERPSALEGARRITFEEPRRGASGHMLARGRDGPRPRATQRA